MYPTYCIDPTGRTKYITPAIYLDNANCDCYLWYWTICEKSIRVFLLGNIYHYLPSGDGIALPVHSNNDHHGASIFFKLHVLFREWMPVVDSLYQKLWWYRLS